MSDERHPFLAGPDEEGIDALALERESLEIWRECAADPGYDIAQARLTWREEAESLAERGIVLADLLETLESQNQALQEAEAVALKRYGDIARDNGELRTQNQALREELRKYQPAQGEGWPDDRHEFAGRLTTLREVAEGLQDERDSLIGDIADSWAPRVEALEEKNRQLELQRASALEEGRKRGKFNRSRNEEARKRVLQERIGELTRANYRMHLLYEVTPPEKNALERIDALQERAEKAEAERDKALRYIGRPRNAPSYTALQEALEKIADDGAVVALEDIEDIGAWAAETIHGYKTIARNALSPTQETDPG